MKLPNLENAYVPSAKLSEYLLSETHPIGKAKARFLRAVGFDENSVNLLEQGLIAIAQSEEVKETTSSPHGTKYVIEGSLATPDGKRVQMRTVWIIEPDHERPRFVTAYPSWANGRSTYMIHELDTVVLTHDIEENGLKQGDVGAVVHCYNDGVGFEVEFVTAEGETVGELTLTRADIRPMSSSEILHVREIAPV